MLTKEELLGTLGAIQKELDQTQLSLAKLMAGIVTDISPRPAESLMGSEASQPAEVRAKKIQYTFGETSERELIGVEPKLVKVVRLALLLTTQDFMVYDGIRSIEEQKHHVKIGTSKTMASKHLEGLAVDLVPWINGKPTWDWTGCYLVAFAMDQAAVQLGCADRITWGGAWDRTLADFGTDLGSYEQEVIHYRERHAGSDFIDGPHFEWRK